MTSRAWWAAAFFAAVCACSAPATDQQLRLGESAERAGDADAALDAYQRFIEQCAAADPARMSSPRKQQCSSGYLARAELLERTGQHTAAIEAYLGAPAALPWDRASGSAGVYRAGRIYLETGQAVKGYELLWRTITHYPNQGFARDALKTVVRDGRKRNPAQLYQVLGDLIQPLAASELCDNLLYTMAELAETELGDLEAALAHYDKLTLDFEKSTMRDDALWHGARLARRLGDARGAVARLKKLLATREVAFLTGSYFSVWLDNGQLELGLILRDDLREYRAALRAFRTLPAHYPDSILVDDAAWHSALTYQAMNDSARACATLNRLREKWPDSKYHLQKAPALRKQLGCD